MASYLDKTGLTYLWGKIISVLVDRVSSVRTTAESDLDIVDEDNNVLVRCADGHIQTKYFNSANAISSTSITHVVYLTQAAYDALATKDANTLYIIPES